MNRIEERLRRLKPEMERQFSHKFSFMDEAADEIDRLRKVEKAACAYYQGYVQDEAHDPEICGIR